MTAVMDQQESLELAEVTAAEGTGCTREFLRLKVLQMPSASVGNNVSLGKVAACAASWLVPSTSEYLYSQQNSEKILIYGESKHFLS